MKPVLPSARSVFIAFVVLPIVALTAAWLFVRSERSKLAEKGLAACEAKKKDRAWCEAAAKQNHERCVELTFHSSRYGSYLEEDNYVECIEVGEKEFWKRSGERADDARRKKKED